MSLHAKPSVIELYNYIRENKKNSKTCPVRFSGIPKAQLLKIAFDLGYKLPAVKRTDVKKGKQVKKIGNKLKKKLEKDIQKKKKEKVLNELKTNVKAIKIKEKLKKTIIPKDKQNKIMEDAYKDFFNTPKKKYNLRSSSK